MNQHGLYALFKKEVWRFLKVVTQTVFTPMITVLLYLIVFSSVLSEHVPIYNDIHYNTFLVPGLIMMAVLQNAFANSSSSLFQARQNGNVLFMLLAPLSSWESFLAYVGASVIRGCMVGLSIWVVAIWLVDLPLAQPLWVLMFAMLGSALLGTLGLIAGIWADKWDHISAFQNFVILPLSFLSGVFYSINSLPSPWNSLSHYNPFFYMIDGFRHGFLGISDINPWFSFAVVSFTLAVCSGLCIAILNSGYKLRS